MTSRRSGSQRDTLLSAFTDSIAANGFKATTAADVARAAGLSPAVFHKHFTDMEDCFCAAMEMALSDVMDRIAAAQRIDAPWPARLRNGVTAVLELLASRPGLAWMVMVEAPSSGRRPPKLYASARRISCSLLDRGREGSPVADLVPSTASAAALSAAEALIFGKIVDGEADRLSELAPQIIYIIVSQYRSQEEALQQFELAGSGR